MKFTASALLLAVVVGAAMQLAASKPTRKLRLPGGVSLEELKKNRGMKQADLEQVRKNIKRANQLANKLRRGVEIDDAEAESMTTEFLDDTPLTLEQSQFLLHSFEKEEAEREGRDRGKGWGRQLRGRGRRTKRKVLNFDRFPTSKWTDPDSNDGLVVIPVKFDGTHDDETVAKIEAALKHWEDNTCVRFEKLEADDVYSGHHILFTSDSGCWSYIGQVNLYPQQVNLHPTCFYTLGTPVHEIGHALGLLHEHVRPDRDDYVTVNLQNVDPDRAVNFEIWEAESVATNSIPYDFASVMHYTQRAFSIDKNSLDTIVAKEDPQHQYSMGQRTGLSFLDIKLVNIEYCSESSNCPALSCANGGHVDPNNCQACQCPDGYGGALCDEVAPSDVTCPTANGQTDGIITVTSEEQCISLSSYSDFTQCNWKLQASDGCQIQMYFVDDFSVFCNGAVQEPTCYHWVEIKNHGTPTGKRFCCYQTPDGGVMSEANEAMVTFRSNFVAGFSGWTQGFTLCYKLSNSECATTTTTTPEPTTSTTTTPEPTTTTTTTPDPTTTTTKTPKPTTTTTTPEPTTSTTTTPKPTTTTTTTPEPITTTATTTPKPTTTTSTTPEPTSTTTTTPEPTTTTTTPEPTTTTTTTPKPTTTTTTTTPEPTTTTTTTTTSAPTTTARTKLPSSSSERDEKEEEEETEEEEEDTEPSSKETNKSDTLSGSQETETEDSEETQSKGRWWARHRNRVAAWRRRRLS